MAADEWRKLRRYAGQWIAMHGNRIIGHGKTLKEAYRQASKVCKEPMVFQVPESLDEVYLL